MISILALCLTAIFTFAAPTGNKVNAETSRVLLHRLQTNPIFNLGEQNGVDTYGALVRCFDPEGTGNSQDKLYCSGESPKDSAQSTDFTDEATAPIHIEILNDKYYAGMGQGWTVHAANFRCYVTKADAQGAYCLKTKLR